jgi:hypothetical protein
MNDNASGYAPCPGMSGRLTSPRHDLAQGPGRLGTHGSAAPAADRDLMSGGTDTPGGVSGFLVPLTAGPTL